MRPSDAQRCVRLVPARSGHRAFVRRLSAEAFARFGDYETTLPEWMDQSWVRTVVAESAGRAVGFTMCALQREPAVQVELLAIAVDPDWQRRGIGRLLLADVEAVALERASEAEASVHLNVAEDNTRAREVFERAGFVEVPGEEGSYPGGQRSLAMVKRLTRASTTDGRRSDARGGGSRGRSAPC